MLKNLWKKYGKMVAAAVFLTAAGLCYGFAGGRDETVVLADSGRVMDGDETKSWLDRVFSGETASDKRAEEETGAGLAGADSGGEPGDEASTNLAETETQVPMCYVHICGEVNEPGVYELPEGSRIFEAVEAAGGLTNEAEESGLNLAEKIEDGMQIVIPDKAEAELQKQAAAEASAGLVNLNKASREQLMTLPGIGESRAEDIINYREESGEFQTIEDIMKVPGIKDAAFQKIKDSITV